MDVSSAGHLSHPSVRLIGMEEQFNPLNCVDERCKHFKTIHFHCPFCVQCNTFANAAGFKLHYSVMHVDRSIDFAGFKHLCCYRDCKKAGTNSPSTRGHWHCFECCIIFPRKQSAFLHFKVLRNSQMPLQVYVAKDLNALTVFHDEEKGLLGPPNNLSCRTLKSEPYKGTPVVLEGSTVSLSSDSQEDFSSEASEPAAQEKDPNILTTLHQSRKILQHDVNTLSVYHDKEEEILGPPNSSLLNYETGNIDPENEASLARCTPVVVVGSAVSLSSDCQEVEEHFSSQASEPAAQGNEPKIATILQKYKKILPHAQNETITYNINAEVAESAQNATLINLVKKLENEIIQLTAKKVSLELELESEARQLKSKVPDTESAQDVAWVNLVKDLQNEIIQLTEKNVNLELKMKTEVRHLKLKLRNQEEELKQLRKQVNSKFPSVHNIEESNEEMEKMLMVQLVKVNEDVNPTVSHHVKDKPVQDSADVYSNSEQFLLPEKCNVRVDKKPSLRSSVGKSTTDCVSKLSKADLPVSQILTRAGKRKCEDLQVVVEKLNIKSKAVR